MSNMKYTVSKFTRPFLSTPMDIKKKKAKKKKAMNSFVMICHFISASSTTYMIYELVERGHTENDEGGGERWEGGRGGRGGRDCSDLAWKGEGEGGGEDRTSFQRTKHSTRTEREIEGSRE